LQKVKEFIKIIKEEHNFINLFWTNFYEVDKGIYRSAQLTPWKLKKIIKKYKIKTIINLRGNNENYLYKKEEEICKKFGVDYYKVSLLSRNPHKIRRSELEKLINIFKSAKKPILFHCKAGADRSGFSAVLWHILQGKNKYWAIKKELRFKYAYLSFTKAGRIKKLFEMYDENENFLEWFDKNRDLIEKSYKKNRFFDFLYDKVLRRE